MSQINKLSILLNKHLAAKNGSLKMEDNVGFRS